VGRRLSRRARRAARPRGAKYRQDVPFTNEMAAAIDEEIVGLAAWLGLEIRRP